MSIDWHTMWIPSQGILETILRGTIMYWVIFGLLRVVIRREAGGYSLSDILVLVVIADAAANAMAGSYQSVTEGIALVATIIGWAFFLDYASYRWKIFAHISAPSALLLVKNGRVIHKNLAAEMITQDELIGNLRKEGITKLAEVKEAYIESDGQISVIRF